MAKKTNPLIFKLTDAGKLAALDAKGETPKISIHLTHLAIGKGRYDTSGKERALKSEIMRVSLVSDNVEVVSNTLRFSASIEASAITPVYELGLFTEAGLLFALASSVIEPLFTIHPNIVFVGSFGIALKDADASNITVSIDPNGTLSAAIMAQHLAAPNPHPQYLGLEHLDVSKDPHPQYLDFKRFRLLLEVLIPMGYLHHTHSTANPKPDFDELLGINTAWRRLLGKTIVATDPADPFIKDVGMTLGQKGMTTAAGETRPHTYPLYTTNIFERYNPDDVVETVWQVSANKTSIDEGAAIRFTVSANNIPDGQILKWTVKEGALNSASNDVTAPDATKSGSVILKNGSAIIDYTTTPDDNIAEAQKHVRLTVGAPANLSMNVPIMDAGRNETIVHISSSTNNGIILDEYYKKHSGAYPLATDKVRFIVNEFVDVIAADTSSAAITDGERWPAGSQIVVENRGRILGRGGDGGQAATVQQIKTSDVPTYDYTRTPPTAGGDGGTAIRGNIKVENYGLIAGGGGGGGGAGYFFYSAYGMGFSGGAGGGAPLGRRYPNPHSYEEYLEAFEAPNKYTLPPLKNTTTGLTYDNYNELAINGSAMSRSYIRGEIFSGIPLKSDIVNIDGYRHPVSTMFVKFYIPNYLDGNKTNYRLWSWSDSRGWVDGFRQSTSATIESKGMGGVMLFTASGGTGQLLTLSKIAGLDITKNKGGDGGSYGENGEASLLGEFYSNGNKGSLVPFKVKKSDLTFIYEPERGGNAGFIKEGAVIINNFTGGVTKGR